MVLRNPYPIEVPAERIPPIKRVLARLHPIPYIIDDKHFLKPMVVYLAYCREHGIYFLDYPHGYSQYLLCPRCFEEWKRRVEHGC